MDGENRFVVDGRLYKWLDRRESPAGVPILRWVLEHRSGQEEAGQRRESRFRIVVVACGPSLAQALAGGEVGTRMRVEGFLHGETHRDQGPRLVLHAQRVTIASE